MKREQKIIENLDKALLACWKFSHWWKDVALLFSVCLDTKKLQLCPNFWHRDIIVIWNHKWDAYELCLYDNASHGITWWRLYKSSLCYSPDKHFQKCKVNLSNEMYMEMSTEDCGISSDILNKKTGVVFDKFMKIIKNNTQASNPRVKHYM